ncbi:cytochrome P450 [Lindgomyces ingoldianus]|uniref:Cytochrome P450 n=1 Tax=Lindgomyces ingoldianus TaxID=673940 RepID=A0ACB6QCW0_9PLEO|nr:cytochrome P450 [Lindgomyces ingoldianus]KAF2464741.1 cytochrome P450 [Lindgomyces ingoldianus]
MDSLSVSSILKLLTPYLPVIIVFYLIISYTTIWWRLRHFKGPWLAKFSYGFMAKAVWYGKMNAVYTEVNEKYGSLARIGPNDLITSDPDILRHMSSARSTYKRSSWYEAMRLDPYVDSILSEMSVPIHDARRAKMASAYSGKENPNLEGDIDEQIASFIALIRRKYLSEGATMKKMDMGRKAQYFTLDVITKVSFGRAFGYLEQDKDVHDYVKTTDELVPWLTFFAVVPLANAILNRSWVKEKLGPGPGDKSGVGRLMGVARDVVQERFGENKIEKQDMLGAFVRNGIPQRQIEAEVHFQIIAGSDTTATAIRSTLLHLLTSPRVLAKLRTELDTAEREGRISNPITNAESKALPYLQAVVKEGVRIHPPFTGLVMKEVPAGGDTIGSQFVPGGTRVAHNLWAVQRDPIYGEDREIFRPERWIEADSQKGMRMEQTLDLVFGHGRWGCLGKNVAWIELNKIFVELLRHFDFEFIDPSKPWRSVNFNLFMQDHMWLRITERKEKN